MKNLTQLISKSDFKQIVNDLTSDHLMILRQTKIDPETDKLFTKYTNVNSLEGT